MQPVRELTDRYLPEETLSSDSRLTVLSAVDSQGGGHVAVELVEGSEGATAGVAGQFLETVAALGRLFHASLPTVIDGGATEEGKLFLVREPVEGRSFDTLGGESPGQIVSLLLQVIGGLETLAKEQIFHGSLSMETLWVMPEPERVRVQITGLAHAAWASRAPGADFDRGYREDVRDLAVVAARLFAATVTQPSSATPGVQLPLAIAFELEEAEELRDLLERCLRQDPAERPASYSEMRVQLCEALWGGSPAKASVDDSGAPPARLTFTTVPEYTLVQAIDGVSAGEPEDEGEITKVVLPEEVEGWEDSAEATSSDTVGGPDTAAAAELPDLPEPDEILSPIDFVPTGEETATPAEAADEAPPEPPAPAPLPEEEVAALAPDSAREAPLPAAPVPAAQPQPAAAPAQTSRPPAASRVPPSPAPPSPVPSAPAPPSPAPPAAAPPTPAQAGKPPAELPPPARGGRPKWLLPLILGGAALAALAVVAAGLYFVLSRGESPPQQAEVLPSPSPAEDVAPGVPEAAEPDDPTAALDERIGAAVTAFLDAEDPAEARSLLAAISPEERARLSARDCAAIAALETSLELTVFEEVFSGLTQGLAAGDLPRLRTVLSSLGSDREAFLTRYPASAGDLQRASRAVGLFDLAREAIRDDRPEEVLRITGVLMESFPNWQGALSLRETAAVTLEGQADLLFEQGRYEQALERLAVLSAEWPDREGLDRRDELIRTRRASERDVGELLTAAEQAGQDGRPDDGLALLSGVHATRRLNPRLNELRDQLETQLAELDRAAPRLGSLDDTTAEFARDETARIAFRVADDFRVDRVSVTGRAEGGDWEVLPHRRRSGDARDGEYEVEIGPDVHANKVVEYYVTATDVSGHIGTLGSAEAPLEVRRKRWFRRLLPR